MRCELSFVLSRPSLQFADRTRQNCSVSNTLRTTENCLDLSDLICRPIPYARQHPTYGECLEVKREYYQNSSVLDCVTQCSQSAAHLCEQMLQVKQIGFVTLGPLRCA